MFAANVIADTPDSFFAYLIGSPSIWVDPSVLARVDKVTDQGRGKRAYIGVGGAETPDMLEGAANLAALLSGPSSTFVLRSQVFEGEEHLPYYAQMTPLAFAFCLPAGPPPPELRSVPQPAPSLARHLGVYRLADRRQVRITRRDDSLMFELDGQPAEEIFGIERDRFFFQGMDAEVIFNDDQTNCGGLTLRVGKLEATALRIG